MIQGQLQGQSAITAQQQQDFSQLVRNQNQLSADSARRDRVKQKLSEGLANTLPPHLQIVSTLSESERKRIISACPEFEGFPEPIKDSNGLGAKAIPEGQNRKWVLNSIPKFQQEHLEVLRVATGALHRAADFQNASDRANFYESKLKEVLLLSVDSAQRLAKAQLKEAFKAAGVEGAYSLMHLDDDDPQWAVDEHTLFQEEHISAIRKYRSFSTQLKQQTRDGYKANKGGYRRSGGGYRGGGGGGRGGYRGGGGGGRVGYRGSGRGGRGGRGGGRSSRDQQGNGEQSMARDEE